MKFVMGIVDNIVGKEENVGRHYSVFSPFPKGF